MLLLILFEALKHKELIDRCRGTIKKLSNENDQQIMKPGHYSFNGVSFDLHLPLFGLDAPGIKSFASDDSYIAIMQTTNPSFNGFVFSDGDTQSLMLLSDPDEQVDDIVVYPYEALDPLYVFRNLEMYGTVTQDGKTLDLLVNWDQDTNGAKQRSVEDWLNYSIGTHALLS